MCLLLEYREDREVYIFMDEEYSISQFSNQTAQRRDSKRLSLLFPLLSIFIPQSSGAGDRVEGFLVFLLCCLMVAGIK